MSLGYVHIIPIRPYSKDLAGSWIFFKVEDLSWIQKPMGIKGALKTPHNVNCSRAKLFLQRSFLTQTDAVFAL